MNKENTLHRYQRLSAELVLQESIVVDIENQESDVVIRARKEVARIKHDICELLKAM